MRVGLALLLLSLVGCDEVETRVSAQRLPPQSVELDVEELGPLTEKAVRFYAARPEVDKIYRLPAGSCAGDCAFLEVTAWIRNKTEQRLAPPVIRLTAPPGRPPRAPIALRAEEVSPGRTGRIRVLVELWPEEKTLDVDLSGSTFFSVDEGYVPGMPLPPASGPPADRDNDDDGDG